MSRTVKSVGIIGTGRYLPERVLTNYDLERIVDTSDEWIRTRTGISERRISDADTATSDLATAAALKAMKNAGVTAGEIDAIIVATATPDMAFPSTACIVQSNLDAEKAFAFDVQAACTGFIYGLSIGEKFISTGDAKTVLVIGSETLTKICNWEDRNTCVLFGDGAGAAILREVECGEGILASLLGAEGWKGKFLTLPAGGSRMPASIETVKGGKHFIHMDGGEVYKFAVGVMPAATLKVVEKAGLTLEDIDFIVPHQANKRIVESAAKRLKIGNERIFMNLTRYGNMSSASIPVALDEALEQGLIKKGDNVVLVGFGAGLTWGSCVINWSR
ncbi:MAG: beta-ketoacyl-ACP synthase III [Bacillota bacterium]|nr:ketoacyl-ACP synthase III [Bacillota bacterium]MDD3297497.1 ketoacyl-ACP synthase III [Bacillota bacterium]MDD3850170.1 ketoacyl-ACP synthase III [Bacillota bacterium]MDD4706893.1 ketoacyl-ACP synthase III [Bacillota bacterium]